MTQTERVLDYIDKHGSINPMQALNDLGIMRLASRMSDLKREGHMVVREMVPAVNRYGEKVTYAKYTIIGRQTT